MPEEKREMGNMPRTSTHRLEADGVIVFDGEGWRCGCLGGAIAAWLFPASLFSE